LSLSQQSSSKVMKYMLEGVCLLWCVHFWTHHSDQKDTLRLLKSTSFHPWGEGEVYST
jgi:hypothetical protein